MFSHYGSDYGYYDDDYYGRGHGDDEVPDNFVFDSMIFTANLTLDEIKKVIFLGNAKYLCAGNKQIT